MKIQTDFIYPPIPTRNCDWVAVDSDTYDGAPDCNCPIGRGATEAEAVADLLAQIEERSEVALETAEIRETELSESDNP